MDREFSLLYIVHNSSWAYRASYSVGTEALSPEVKWLGYEADHSFLFSAKVKNVCSYTFTLLYVFMAYSLIKHRDNFIFIFID
jgi:hypothetical protein